MATVRHDNLDGLHAEMVTELSAHPGRALAVVVHWFNLALGYILSGHESVSFLHDPSRRRPDACPKKHSSTA